MSTARILVTGATGRVGGQVLRQLLDAGIPARALVRDPAKATLPAGAEVVRGDLTDPAGLDAALDGIDAVFLLVTSLDADQAAALVTRLADRPRHVVYLSSTGTRPEQAGQGGILGGHARMEQLIDTAGVPWTFVRPGGFAANTLGWAEQIRAGDEVRWFHGAAVRSLVHEADIARVAVRALTEDGHVGVRHEFTGPQQLDQFDQLRIIGKALGRELTFVELDADTAVRELFGWAPEELARAIVDGHAGMARHPEEPTEVATLTALLGRPPHDFHDWVADHLADFS